MTDATLWGLPHFARQGYADSESVAPPISPCRQTFRPPVGYKHDRKLNFLTIILCSGEQICNGALSLSPQNHMGQAEIYLH